MTQLLSCDVPSGLNTSVGPCDSPPVDRPNSALPAPSWPCELRAQTGVEAGPPYLDSSVYRDRVAQGAKPLLPWV